MPVEVAAAAAAAAVAVVVVHCGAKNATLLFLE